MFVRREISLLISFDRLLDLTLWAYKRVSILLQWKLLMVNPPKWFRFLSCCWDLRHANQKTNHDEILDRNWFSRKTFDISTLTRRCIGKLNSLYVRFVALTYAYMIEWRWFLERQFTIVGSEIVTMESLVS